MFLILCYWSPYIFFTVLMRSSLILAENLLHSQIHYLLSSHIIGKWPGLGVSLQALRTLYTFAAIYKCCLKQRVKLVEPITGDHPVKLPKTLFASWAVRCLLFVMLNSSFRGLDMRGKENFGVSRFKVARYSFSGSIHLKCEHKLRRHKPRFGKIATAAVLHEDGNLLWSGLTLELS